MPKASPILLLFAALCIPVAAVAQVPSDLQQAIRERDRAVDEVDAATWDRLTAPDFTVVQQGGTLLSKAERLAQFRQQQAPATPAVRAQDETKMYGNTAVRRLRSGNAWVLEVWVKDAEGWRVAAVQLTTAATS
jgi:hypothetical protein